MLKRIFGFILIAAFSALFSYGINSQFLKLLERSHIDQKLMVFFLACALTYILFILWVDGVKTHWKWNPPRFDLASWRDNLPGIVLSVVFVFVYLRFAVTLNNFGVGQVDNLFDADVGSWMRRIAFEDVKDFEMRGPHPFTYFIFRPFGLFLNLFTKDPTLSAILFNTISGGACVFLMWLFVKRQFGSKPYALLMAAFLGLSSAHFFFGSVIETYIYSALALLLFFVLLQSNASLPVMVAGGALTFGITLTNFVQTFFGFAASRPRLREIIRFAGWTIAVSLVLTYLHAYIYPASKLFFLTPDIENEDKFFLELGSAGGWFFAGRLTYLLRTVILYSVIAPKAFILTEEVGSTIPEFRFYKISPGIFHQTDYAGLGQGLVIAWAGILAVSGIVFLWNLYRTRKAEVTVTSLILCLLFNVGIHASYGQELFLYSPDWTYALILFAAFGLAPFAKNRLFQLGMFAFLILLAFNQWQFVNIVLGSLAEFIRARP